MQLFSKILKIQLTIKPGHNPNFHFYRQDILSTLCAKDRRGSSFGGRKNGHRRGMGVIISSPQPSRSDWQSDLQRIGTAHAGAPRKVRFHLYRKGTRYNSIRFFQLCAKTPQTGLDLPQKHLDFVGKINTASIPTRYPDDLQ